MGKAKHFGRLTKEVWHFAWERKAWWIVPLFITLILIALMVATSQSSAPFIYTLF
jgi:hypothetical protein